MLPRRYFRNVTVVAMLAPVDACEVVSGPVIDAPLASVEPAKRIARPWKTSVPIVKLYDCVVRTIADGCVSGAAVPDARGIVPVHPLTNDNEPVSVPELCDSVRLTAQLEKGSRPPVHVPVKC